MLTIALGLFGAVLPALSLALALADPSRAQPAR